MGIRAPAIARSRCRTQPLDLSSKIVDLFREGPFGGEPGRHSGDRSPVIAELTDVLRRKLAESWRRAIHVVVDGHVGEGSAGASASGHNEPAFPQGRERFTQRYRRDAQSTGELRLRRQLLAVEDQAETNGLAETLRDLVCAPSRIGVGAQYRANRRRREAEFGLALCRHPCSPLVRFIVVVRHRTLPEGFLLTYKHMGLVFRRHGAVVHGAATLPGIPCPVMARSDTGGKR